MTFLLIDSTLGSSIILNVAHTPDRGVKTDAMRFYPPMFRRLLAGSSLFCLFWAHANNQAASAQYAIDVAYSASTLQQGGGGPPIPVIGGSALLSNLPPGVQSATTNFEFYARLRAPGQNPNPNPWQPFVTDSSISGSPTMMNPNINLQTGWHSYNPASYQYYVKARGSFVQPGNAPGSQITYFDKDSPVTP